jgi:hypothetical protein
MSPVANIAVLLSCARTCYPDSSEPCKVGDLVQADSRAGNAG